MISVDKPIIDVQQRFQKQYNLDKVLKILNNPQNCIPTINVVGTNGKGSTSFYLSKGLLTKYERVGLFISPAFIYHNERIQINNQPISDEALVKLIEETKFYVKEFNLTFFEIWTLIAILHFASQKVDIIVMEAGIGGLRDATSLMSNQLFTLVTSISFDHTEILGASIEQIIYQKINIAKPKTKLIISDDNLKYEKIIRSNLINKNQIIFANTYQDENVTYQKANKGLVKAGLEQLNINDFECLKLDPPLGRFTKLKCKNRQIIIDGAHNVDGIQSLVNSIENKNITILYGSIEGKEHHQILSILLSNFENVYITSFEHFKSWDVSKLNYANAVADWKKFIDSTSNDILVCGSLYFVPLVYQHMQKKK